MEKINKKLKHSLPTLVVVITLFFMTGCFEPELLVKVLPQDSRLGPINVNVIDQLTGEATTPLRQLVVQERSRTEFLVTNIPQKRPARINLKAHMRTKVPLYYSDSSSPGNCVFTDELFGEKNVWNRVAMTELAVQPKGGTSGICPY